MNATSSHDKPLDEVKVWDPLVRIGHWGLVVCFFIAYLTEDELLDLHIWSGYAVLGYVIFRIIWGIIGPRHARFSDFVFPLGKIVRYVKDSLVFKAPRYLGHNPAGGAMIIALLLCLLATSVSGLAVYGAEEHAGPMADSMANVSEFWKEALEEIHELFSNLTLLLVVMHIGGVLYSSMAHRENLIRAMFTGYKRKH